MNKYFTTILFFTLTSIQAQLWKPDLGDGTYRNPIIFADYSDPDVIRVGDDFYMVSSSFTCMPGIPVLHSKDLVNWTIVGHVYERIPLERFNTPQHGDGAWAPSIRYHDNKFYVYVCSPEDGLWMAIADNPAGPWSPIRLIIQAANWEDPCPFWDDDGKAYLVHSKLCAGPLVLHRLSEDGTQLLDNGVVIFENKQTQPTLEGPKFLKHNGYYYILAPAGGVTKGWQTVLRSKNIYGPYEEKIVLHQGSSLINGPHQGGMVDMPNGDWWFVHFQDRNAFGRIVHLQPVHWIDNWPMMGTSSDSKIIGEPVMSFKKPTVASSISICIPQTSDDFNTEKLGLQWQWFANPQKKWYSLIERKGFMRLHAQQIITENGNPYYAGNVLAQKFSAPSFTVITKMEFSPAEENEFAGIIITGEQYAYLALRKNKNTIQLCYNEGNGSVCGGNAVEFDKIDYVAKEIYLKVEVNNKAECIFFYSSDNKLYKAFGKQFQAVAGKWIGAKVGLFCINPNINVSNQGYADFDWIEFQ